MHSIRIDRAKHLAHEPHTGHNRFHPDIAPALEVAEGEEVILETRDALDGQLGPDATVADLAAADANLIHPLTGPVFVKGAQPGDMIEVEFIDIVPQPTAFSAIVPGLGFLRDVMTTPFVVNWTIRDGWATSAEIPGVRVPGAPFMGISGVAPSAQKLKAWTERWEIAMKVFAFMVAFVGSLCVSSGAMVARAAPCLIVTLTGSMGGPPNFNGLAGPGTLVRYGDEADNCSAVMMQFDAGRGTSMRLSQLNVTPGQINAVFFTHMHSDHADGFADLVALRWLLNWKGPKLDVVCSADTSSTLGFTISCQKFIAHIADAYIQSGEIAQRISEFKDQLAGGPADVVHLITFEARNEPQVVWTSGHVKVSAIRSTHIAGHASYRVDTPAGSVVIGGDAGSDKTAPPRASSTSEEVETLAMGADIIVHSTIHPIMGPDKGSGMPPPIFFRQSTASDLGAMAKRTGAKHLMLTHLIPPIGATRQGPWTIPGGALTEGDYKTAAQDGGFTGNIVVGTDLVSLRLPAK